MDMREWQEKQKKLTGHIESTEGASSLGQHNRQVTDNRAQADSRRHDNNHRHNNRPNNQQRHVGHHVGQRQHQQGGANGDAELFHNPYHFIPAPKGARSGDISRKGFSGGKVEHATHERYLPSDKHHSGRIVCRIETVTPVFIGGQHPDRILGQPLAIPHFELEKKIPAIPATSIRGVIASLAEAASNSALRVLNNDKYSRRAAMNEALKALGMLEKDPCDGRLKLRPLVMPVMNCDDINGTNAYLDPLYAAIFTKAALRVYLYNYQRIPDVNPPQMGRLPETFLGATNPDSYSASKREMWYMQLDPVTPTLGSGKRPLISVNIPHVKTTPGRNGRPDTHQLMGQQSVDKKNQPINEASYKKLLTAQQALYTPGIIRVLGLGTGDERSEHIPNGKTHEMFIPYDPTAPAGKLIELGTALDEFHELAKLRSDLKTIPKAPFTLKGAACRVNDEVKLQEGDLVFFSIDGGSRVTDVAISSIWRRGINGTCHEFFAGISKELLPMNRSRETISIAEQMFGFVSEQEKGSGDLSLAFKSRVRFSNGICSMKPGEEYYLGEQTLKILASPKPPSPSLYFKRKDGSFIPKEGKEVLSKEKGDLPQGRKIYLHHKDAATFKPWISESTLHADQKCRVRPVRDGVSFYFHIDFTNLVDEELQLLCYALAPTKTFMHKIGMGKPIGLGSVRIIPEGLFLIDRIKRYSLEGYQDKYIRYHKIWKLDNPERPAGIYAAEFGSEGENCTSVRERAEQYHPDENIKKAIELLGEYPKYEVHYPRINGGEAEDKLFQWFVANDKGIKDRPNRREISRKASSLKPLDHGSTELPILEAFEWER